MLLGPRPVRPLLFGQRDIGEERSGIERQRFIEGARVASPDQPLERRNVALDEAGANSDAFVAAHDRILAQDAAQPGQRLAQVLPRQGLGMGAPQQRRDLVALLRLGAGADQKGEQARQLARAELDRSRGACKAELAKQPQPKPGFGRNLGARSDVEHLAFRLANRVQRRNRILARCHGA